jgi:hypothetical protein
VLVLVHYDSISLISTICKYRGRDSSTRSASGLDPCGGCSFPDQPRRLFPESSIYSLVSSFSIMESHPSTLEGNYYTQSASICITITQFVFLPQRLELSREWTATSICVVSKHLYDHLHGVKPFRHQCPSLRTRADYTIPSSILTELPQEIPGSSQLPKRFVANTCFCLLSFGKRGNDVK